MTKNCACFNVLIARNISIEKNVNQAKHHLTKQKHSKLEQLVEHRPNLRSVRASTQL